MGKTLAQLKSEMSLAEFSDWFNFYNQHPFGEKARDLRHAVLTANVVAPHTTEDRIDPYDFTVSERKQFKKQTYEEQISIAKSIANYTQQVSKNGS